MIDALQPKQKVKLLFKIPFSTLTISADGQLIESETRKREREMDTRESNSAHKEP